jgi:hypothetical protein
MKGDHLSSSLALNGNDGRFKLEQILLILKRTLRDRDSSNIPAREQRAGCLCGSDREAGSGLPASE